MGSEREEVRFRALEYTSQDSFEEHEFLFRGSPAEGWEILRDNRPNLRLGPGYRLLATETCGVCSTDLDRRFLPFPLPQITGHELVARDSQGKRFVVEINASHRARGLKSACPLCDAGLPSHCPERLVLGIHDLPGGFGPWVLAPIEATIALPASLSSEVAALCEPFAAALHGVRRTELREGMSVAVLGPRRLGLLCVAALRAEAKARSIEIDLIAVSRHQELLDRARQFGADRGILFAGEGEELEERSFDLVFDTTGSPSGLELSLRLARHEVHLKSTHGRPSGGLKHTTELVVDELGIHPLPEGQASLAKTLRELSRAGAPAQSPGLPRVLWLAAEAPPDGLAELCHLSFGESLEDLSPPAPGYDAAVVADASAADLVIRPRSAEPKSLLRPRGVLFAHPSARDMDSSILQACATRGLRLTSSRCGDFRQALDLLAQDPELATRLASLVTDRFAAAELPRAFAVARSADCIKALVHHSPVEALSSRESAS